MSSTVTAFTISTLTSGMTATLSLIAIVTLLLLLINKEIVVTGPTPQARLLRRALNFTIPPLLFVFGMLLVLKFIEIVG